MTNKGCEHVILRDTGIVVASCETHSNPPVSQRWVWDTAELARPCPCAGEGVSRFTVVTKPASARSICSGDVIIGRPQATLDGARRVAERLCRVPGWRLVIVAAGEHGMVLRGASREITLTAEQASRVCPGCLYPWLVAGHSLDDLAEGCARA